MGFDSARGSDQQVTPPHEPLSPHDVSRDGEGHTSWADLQRHFNDVFNQEAQRAKQYAQQHLPGLDIDHGNKDVDYTSPDGTQHSAHFRDGQATSVEAQLPEPPSCFSENGNTHLFRGNDGTITGHINNSDSNQGSETIQPSRQGNTTGAPYELWATTKDGTQIVPYNGDSEHGYQPGATTHQPPDDGPVQVRPSTQNYGNIYGDGRPACRIDDGNPDPHHDPFAATR
jgi:hypothetical protein